MSATPCERQADGPAGEEFRRWRWRETLVVLMCLIAAMAYGVAHDQVTARVCLEYFTIAHPPLFPTGSVTLLAACWGVAATVGIGAVLGVVLALVSQAGPAPAIPLGRLLPLVLGLLAATAAAALLAGLLGYGLARAAIVGMPGTLAPLIVPQRHDRFMAVWFAHGASYLVGLAGGLWLVYGIWRQRGKPRVLTVFPRTKWAMLRWLLLIALAALAAWYRFSR